MHPATSFIVGKPYINKAQINYNSPISSTPTVLVILQQPPYLHILSSWLLHNAFLQRYDIYYMAAEGSILGMRHFWYLQFAEGRLYLFHNLTIKLQVRCCNRETISAFFPSRPSSEYIRARIVVNVLIINNYLVSLSVNAKHYYLLAFVCSCSYSCRCNCL